MNYRMTKAKEVSRDRNEDSCLCFNVEEKYVSTIS